MRNILGLSDDGALSARYFSALIGHFLVIFFFAIQLFTLSVPFTTVEKNPTIRTTIIPSGNVSGAGDESETDSENLSNFESSEESEVESKTEEEVVEESSSTKSDTE